MASELGDFPGRWRITAMEQWAQEDVDLVGEGFLEFGRGGLGNLRFICVQAGIDWQVARSSEGLRAEFSFDGFDEGDQVSGRGWARIEPDGSLYGWFKFHMGDESWFKAERKAVGSAARKKGLGYGG